MWSKARELDPERVDAWFYIGQHWRLAGKLHLAVSVLSDAVGRVLQCVVVCCSVLQCVASSGHGAVEHGRSCVAVCCSVLQCVAASGHERVLSNAV